MIMLSPGSSLKVDVFNLVNIISDYPCPIAANSNEKRLTDIVNMMKFISKTKIVAKQNFCHL